MSEITRYEIDMLDVGAADAILIRAFVKRPDGRESEYVVLVDAGNEGDGEKILSHIREHYTQQYIDLAICTHCDSDHYGGFKRLIEEHNKHDGFSIKKFWVHDPYKHVDVDDVKYIRNEETLRKRLNDAYAFSNGSNLIELIDYAAITREEPLKGTTYEPLNINVLGPSKEYYESLIPDFRVNLDFKEEQRDDVYGLFAMSDGIAEDDFYSKALEKAADDQSKVNQSSVVFLMEACGDRLLFTGDAGKEALHKVVDNDWRGTVKDVTFLKVPHHGSKHNLDNAIIAHLHPGVSYISTEKIGKFANQATINALKKVCSVYSTHKGHSSLWHHIGTADRTDYSPATPL